MPLMAILDYRIDNPRRPTAADRAREKAAKNRWSRLNACGAAIAALPEDHTSADVLLVLQTYSITAFDFQELDERPRQFSRWDWHPALRRVRNDPSVDLFAHLTE